MNSEIEAKFLDQNHDEIRQQLTDIGARLVHPMRLMKRVTIDSPCMKAKDAFLRVRDQGDTVTLTYKQFDALSIDGAKEIEVDVSNFHDTIAILSAAGLPHGSLQESKRETWALDGAKIVLDIWPWLKPYIEIEGESETVVATVVEWYYLPFLDKVVLTQRNATPIPMTEPAT